MSTNTWTPAQSAFTTYQEMDGGGRGVRKSVRKIMYGEGMLTPDRSFTWRGEHYLAGKTRVSPDHEVCFSQFAPLLMPAYDKEASYPVLQFLERIRGRGRRRAAASRGTPSWRLGGRTSDQAWRL